MYLLHNPRCSKSRNSFNWLTENGHEFETVEYLKNPISKEQLRDILKKLDIKAEDLIRKGEEDYKKNFKGKDLNEDQWIDAMLEFPKLIERPILVTETKAAIGRPLENLIELAKAK